MSNHYDQREDLYAAQKLRSTGYDDPSLESKLSDGADLMDQMLEALTGIQKIVDEYVSGNEDSSMALVRIIDALGDVVRVGGGRQP